MPLADLLEPARRLAADGFALDGRLARTLASAPSLDNGEPLARLLGGQNLAPGDRFVQRELADSLASIAAGGRDGFYRGVLAEQITEHVLGRGGALTLEDLAAHRGEWVEPMAVWYRGVRVTSNDLVSSGVLLLLALRVVEQLWPAALPDDEVEVSDTLVRLKQVLFARVAPLLGDPACGAVPDVLGQHFVAEVTSQVRERLRAPAALPVPVATDTTSLAVTDRHGAAVCFIHSLFNEFGSREVVPGTGIVLNDRLAGLVVGGDGRAAPNALAPRRRPLHTLHCYMAEWPDGRVVAGATPGGRGQVQTNTQVLLRLIDRRDTLGAAVSSGRWLHGLPRSSADDDTLYVEPGLGHLGDDLARLGHRVEVVDGDTSDRFGNCTIVARRGGELEAAADHRRGGKGLVDR
jgi:gamma-glutamyltranspeptidase/glutathione hydrolase